MAKHTINRLLAMQKSLHARVSQLEAVKNASVKETHWTGDDGRVEKPVYDVKIVDRKIVAINKALFEIDHRIKETNAKTEVEIDIDYDKLVSEIE